MYKMATIFLAVSLILLIGLLLFSGRTGGIKSFWKTQNYVEKIAKKPESMKEEQFFPKQENWIKSFSTMKHINNIDIHNNRQTQTINETAPVEEQRLKLVYRLEPVLTPEKVQQCALYEMNYNKVWIALVEAINKHGEKIQSLSKENGTIETSFRLIDVERINEITSISDSEAQWTMGRYKLDIALSSVASSETKIIVTPSIMGWRVWVGLEGEEQPLPMRPANWMPLLSNGSLEEEIFNEISQNFYLKHKECPT
jgi:hypothetical protein